jgi:predicted Rossmann-fold nucleotide-binding protein
MEAASRGARDGGARALGVVSDIFKTRKPNAYLSETFGSHDLYERTRRLIDLSDGYVVLAGKAGTLAELTWVWALARAGCLPLRPVVPLGGPWREIIGVLDRHGILDPVALRMTELADDEHQAVEILQRRFARETI